MRGTYSKQLTILGHRRRFAMEEAASRAGVERLMCPNLRAESNKGGGLSTCETRSRAQHGGSS